MAVPVLIPIREIVATLDDHDPFLTSSGRRLRRQYAAAGLARCRALLDGVCLVIDGGRRDVSGVLARCVAEVYLVSLYVLYKGEGLDDNSVLWELQEGFARYAIPLAKRQGKTLPWLSILAKRKGVEVSLLKPNKLRKLNMRAVATSLPSLLQGSRIGSRIQSFDPVEVYELMMNFESLFSVHAGAGPFENYFTFDPTEDDPLIAILEAPEGPVPFVEVACAGLTLNLARHIYANFGVKVSDGFVAVERQFERIAAADPLGLKAPQ